MSSQIPPLELIDGTFFIDNSRWENLAQCEKRGEFAIAHKRVPSKFNAALFCGEVVHLCQKFRYGFYPVQQPVPPECTYKQLKLIERCYDGVLLSDPKEYRSCAFVKAVMRAYNLAYPTENFKLVLNPKDGLAIVEKSFAVPLGEIDGIKLVWIGRLDLAIELENGEVWVHDFKTSAMGGDTFALPFYTSSQMKGYTKCLSQVLGRPVMGAQIGAIFTRRPTKTGLGTTFERYRIRYDSEVLEAWAENQLHIISDYLHCYKRNYFPSRTTQCVGKFACPYINVCRMAPSAQLNYLYGGDFKSDDWSPLKGDRVNLTELYAEPLPSGWEASVDEVEVKAPKIDPDKLVQELLNGDQPLAAVFDQL